MSSVRRSLALSFIESYALIAISFLSNILLARLLMPKEIGLYSVSLAIIGIAQVLRDFGIGNFLIQEKNLSDAHIRTAFGFSLLIGGGLCIVTYFAAPLAGKFYGEDQIVLTMRISSLNFLVLPFCSISLSLLRRKMAFKQVLIVNFIAAIFNFGVTISLAYSGFGPNSLAIGAVTANIVTGIGAWLARVDRKLLLPGFSEWRTLLNFGGQSVAANIITAISMDINDLATGKILGFAPVAMISRAQGLMNLFHRDVMGAIRNVAFPAFAASHRINGELESQYIFAVAAVTGVAWPFYAFASLFSLELLRLLFGSQWDAAAVLIPWFCLGGTFGATINLIIPLLMAQGYIKQATRIDLMLQPLRAVSIVAGVWHFQTMEAVAIIYAANALIAIPYHYNVKSQVQRNNHKLLLRALTKSAGLTILCCSFPALIYFMAPRIESGITLIYLIIAAVLCASTWICSLILLKHPLVNDPVFAKVLKKFWFLKDNSAKKLLYDRKARSNK